MAGCVASGRPPAFIVPQLCHVPRCRTDIDQRFPSAIFSLFSHGNNDDPVAEDSLSATVKLQHACPPDGI
jgi:hypothetical protein